MARVYRGRELVVRQFEAESKRTGYVYFMRAVPDGLIKIGWSSAHPDARLKRIRATSPTPIAPVALLKGGLELEAALHERFAALWSHGEWFSPDAGLLEHIWAIGEPWPDPVTKHRPPGSRVANPDLALSEEEGELIRWAKGIKCGNGHDSRILTFFEWSELYDIPLAQMWQWKVEGFSVDLVGYYVKLREAEPA